MVSDPSNRISCVFLKARCFLTNNIRAFVGPFSSFNLMEIVLLLKNVFCLLFRVLCLMVYSISHMICLFSLFKISVTEFSEGKTSIVKDKRLSLLLL